MAAAAMGVFDHAITAAQAVKGQAAPAANVATGANGTNGTNGSSDASSNSATISANDFLTLLVTEMQNQDPTADTDPNEYINQLVQVNSLEQLIDINQTLTTGLEATPATDGGTGTTPQVVGAGGSKAANGPVVSEPAAGTAVSKTGNQMTRPAEAQNAVQHAPGNLSVPGVNRAAQRVGHALAGRTRAQPAA